MPPIRILLVADSAPNPVVNGGFTFGDSQQDTYFTLNLLVDTLRQGRADSYQYISVDTAHRSGDPDATIKVPFNFKTTLPDLGAYDEIWLIGYDGSNSGGSGNLNFISEDEIVALATFMDNGGGVLATGDHAGLGSLMCGRIPRVRQMRKWFHEDDTDSRILTGSPRNWPGLGPTRADTLVMDKDDQWTFDNQSDDIPQELRYPEGIIHPILYGSAGPIKTFPDHMHEGEALGFGGITGPGLRTPWILDDKPQFASQIFTEFPTLNGHQELPTVIATGKVTGGHQTLIEGNVRQCETNNFSPDSSKTVDNEINILSVYDGHKVGVGRIVTDSSFHHYLDLNLTGDTCAPDGSIKKSGFQSLAGQTHLTAMKDYFLNLAIWLAGPRVKALTSLTADGSNPRVYYIDGNKSMTQAAWSRAVPPIRSRWIRSVLPGTPHPLGSSLASIAISPTDIRLFYINTDSRVTQLAWNGTSWLNSTLPSRETKRDTPLTCLLINGQDLRVYYVSASNQLSELSQNAPTSAWANGMLPSNQVRSNSPITAFAVGGTDSRIYYIDTQDHVNEQAWVGTHWVNTVLPSNSAPPAMPALSDSGLSCLGINNHDSRVYYLDKFTRLNVLKWVGDHWVNEQFFDRAGSIDSGGQGGSVGCIMNGSSEPQVLYPTMDDFIESVIPDASNPGGWRKTLVGSTPVRQPSAISVLVRGPALIDVYFVGRDEKIYVARWNGSVWATLVV